jgi:hypothetical protein
MSIGGIISSTRYYSCVFFGNHTNFSLFLCVFINNIMRYTGIVIHTQRSKAWHFEYFTATTDIGYLFLLDDELRPGNYADKLPYVICDQGIKLKYGYTNPRKKVAYVPETHPLFNMLLIKDYADKKGREQPIKDMLKNYADKELLSKEMLIKYHDYT